MPKRQPFLVRDLGVSRTKVEDGPHERQTSWGGTDLAHDSSWVRVSGALRVK